MHFNKIPHTLGDFSFQCIDQVQAHNNSEEIERLLITKEAYWSAQLFSLDLMMSSSRLPLDSSHRKLIDQRHLRDTARTEIQPSVAWAKSNANWITEKGFGVEGGGGLITFIVSFFFDSAFFATLILLFVVP